MASWIQPPEPTTPGHSPNAFSPGVWLVLASGVWAVGLFALWRGSKKEHHGLAAALTLGGISIATAIEVARASGRQRTTT